MESNTEIIISLIIAVIMLGYLFYTLIRPDKF
jgi:K+-transporting ATPase KdpF subunit